jgi:hypothetical protein
MNYNNKQNWLQSLSVGDEVGICKSKYGNDYYSIKKIEKITPTRRFIVDGNTYNKNGNKMGMTIWDGTNEIIPITDNVKKIIHRNTMLSKIRSFDLEKLKYEDIINIYDIIKDIE